MALQIAMVLLPFAVLLIGFLVFKMSALKLSIYTWILEIIIVFILYRMSPAKIIQASIWGNISIWSGFLVLYTGQIFGQSFRSTGLLQTLLITLGKLLPTKAGKAITLSTVVGGYVGAFNGFATYPITIPGLVELGISGTRAAVGYLVYFSWSIAFVSLFIAATIASSASGLPVAEIAHVMGLLTIAAVPVSVIGFFEILGFELKIKENAILAILVCIGNIAGIVLFTQIFPSYYVLTLIASSTFCLLLLYFYRTRLPKDAFQGSADTSTAIERGNVYKAFAPLVVGAVIVVLWSTPIIAPIVNNFVFSVNLWGYAPTKINFFTSPGFYILVTAFTCYIFATKKSNVWNDIKVASKRSSDSLLTLLVGGAMVYLMVDTGQIALLARSLTQWGANVYSILLSGVSFLAGMAFGQGIPADFMLSKMQVSAAKLLNVPLVVLVGIAALVTMGPANPLKPSLLRYTSSLANIKGKDGEMFRMAIPWQVLQLIVIAICSALLVSSSK